MTIKNVKTGEFQQSNNCVMCKLLDVNLESLRNSVGIQAAVESSRNENIRRQDRFLNILENKTQRNKTMEE